MTAEDPDRAAVRLSLELAERRMLELDAKQHLTRAEQFEWDMTADTIKRARAFLGDNE